MTFNDFALPLLQTSSGQILAQVPENVSTGINVVQVRSLAMAQASDPVMVTVQRPPAVGTVGDLVANQYSGRASRVACAQRNRQYTL